MLNKWKDLPYLAKIGIVAGTIILLAVGAYMFSLQPLVKANEADALTLKSKQAEIAQLAPYRTKLAELNSQTELLKQQMEAQKRIVPEEKEVPSFISMVETEAIAAGVEVRRYTPKDTMTKEYYVEVPVEIDVDGPYYAVLNFYDRLQKSERIVNVGRLTMGAIKGGKVAGKRTYHWSGSETVSASCLLTTFYSTSKGGAPVVQPAAAKK